MALVNMTQTCPYGVYVYPSAGAIVNIAGPLEIMWDRACFNTTTTAIDVYLRDVNNSLLYEWQALPASAGQSELSWDISWLTKTELFPLHFDIFPADDAASPFPAGPDFMVGIPGATPSVPIKTVVSVVGPAQTALSGALSDGTHRLTSTQLVEVAMGPLLAVLMVGGAIYWVKKTRGKVQRETRHWHDALAKY